MLCSRPKDQAEKFCFFSKQDKSEELFLEEINKLIKLKCGKWTGYKFPDKVELKEITIDFPIDLSYSEISELIISKVSFKKGAIFKYCSFKNNVHFYSIVFEGEANYQNGKFYKQLSIDSSSVFHDKVQFNKGEFLDKTDFSCLFKERVNFNNSIFYDSVIFKGTRTITIRPESAILKVSISSPSLIIKDINELSLWQKIKNKLKNTYSKIFNYIKGKISNVYKEFIKKVEKIIKIIKKYRDSSSYEEIIRVFESEVGFQEVEFRAPELTKFININLSRAYVSGTNFRKVTLLDIVWSNQMGRKKIYDEVRMINSRDKKFKKYVLPRIEDSYRNLRVALEENKDFGSASDFYIGEMEAARLQKLFFQKHLLSVVAAYKILSRYGTSPIQAIFAFIFGFFIQFLQL